MNVKNELAMVENGGIQGKLPDLRPASIPRDTQHDKDAVNSSNQRHTTPSVSDIEAKVSHMASKPGLRNKIDANCLWCSYDPLDVGTWRQQVDRCNVTNCPLFSVRPVSGGKYDAN